MPVNSNKSIKKNIKLESLNIKVEDKDFESDEADTECLHTTLGNDEDTA